MKFNKHKKLIVLFTLMFIFYALINCAFSIYREKKDDKIDLSIIDSSGMVTVRFNANGGTMDPSDTSRSVQAGEQIGQLPEATRTDYNFDGWYTSPTSGEKITENTKATGTIVDYYAHWTKIVCKKASTGTLHSETCTSTGSCAKSGGGYSDNDIIYYGSIPSINSPIVGDAYDCDVNNDGIWDYQTERFYYVRSYGSQNPYENSVLVHYTSFDEDGQMDSSSTRKNYLYEDAENYLPTASTWSNPALIEMNGNVTRLISNEDLTSACGSSAGGNKFENCRFYLENSRYQSKELGRAGIWLMSEGNSLYRIHTEQLIASVAEADSKNTVRPTIEIPSNRIEGFRKKEKYNIYLDSQGGTPSEYNIDRYDGETVGTLPRPTKARSIFAGWYTDNENYTTEIVENDVVTGNIHGYAKWVPKEEALDYVFYIPGECTFTSSGIQNGENGDCISTINPTGSSIDYTESQLSTKKYIDTQVGLYNTINHDKNFEVGFTIESYNPANNVTRSTLVHSKAEIRNKWPGFTFRRDELTNNFILQSRKLESENAFVTFPYTSVQNVKIYRTNGAIYYSINGGEKTWLNNLDQYNPTFDLTTWFGGAPKDETALTAERFFVGTLSNMYIKLSTLVTVTFDPNYPGVSTFDRNVIVDHEVGELPIATRPGYKLLGWYTDPINGTKVTSDTIIDDSITLYAHWAEGVTVSLHANEGHVSPNTVTVLQGAAIGTLPIPERTGYTFVGWYQDSNLTTPVTSDTIVTKNTDFYAKWIENLTISFNADGGEVSPTSKTISPGSVIGDLPIPSKIGYDFVGWYIDNTYTTEVAPSTTFNTSTSIIAKWEELEDITINFDADGGEVNPNSITIPMGLSIDQLPIPEKEGNNFVGWYTDNTYTTEVTSSTRFTETTTIIAKWVDESYVACIGTTCYQSLAAAFNAAPTNRVKTRVKVIKDITTTETTTIASSKSIELDIGNNTVSTNSGTFSLLTNQGVLEIISGNLYSSGGYIIENKSSGIINIYNGNLTYNKSDAGEYKVIELKSGTVNIYGGNLSCNSKAAVINVGNSSSLNIYGGTIKGSNTFKGQAVYNNGGTVTINGTAYLESVSQTASKDGRATLHNAAGTMTILGGTIISKQNSAVKNSGTMIIGSDDGTIDNTNPVMQGYNYGLEIDSGKTVTVYDGIFKGNKNVNNKAINEESRLNLVNSTVIHSNETIDNVEYDVAYLEDTSVNITVNFNKNGGDTVEYNSKTINEIGPIGTLPIATKANSEFLGWYTTATGGEKLLTTTEIDADKTYYAHYTHTATVCKPAKTLHSYGGIEFGQIPTSSSLSAGDAFDCDVNGDGTYDATNERFYYLTNSSDNKAILIYYNNTSQVNNNVSPICSATAVSYAPTFTEGPKTAIGELPNTTQWPNVSLYSEPRTITDDTGNTVYSNYLYKEKAARFATLDEIKAATRVNLNETQNELENFTFLLENTASYGDGCSSNYWLETTNSNSGAEIINGAMDAKSLGHATGDSGVRPVIEIPFESIEGAVNIIEFDTIPGAMRTYFNNVSSWNDGQDDTNYSSFNASMVANLNNYDCAYYDNDNTSKQYGNVFCDQPNKYDTGIVGNINVYEYDETTGVRSNTTANYVFNDNGKLYNFIPGKTYYWESANDSTKHGYVRPIGERRLITILGVNRQTRNIRDFGGLPVDTDGDGTIDGKIKYQKLYRGEKIWGQNRDGRTAAQFEKLGIYNEYDLRASSEFVSSEEDRLSNLTTREIVHYKIDHDEFGSPATEERFAGKSYYQLSRDAAIDVMQRIVAGNDDASIYIHCRIGADRTGTLAYLLEGALGVPTEYRNQDYELTTFYGLRERTRYYYMKETTNDAYKYIYLKKAIRHATPGNDENTGEENVINWFLLEGNSTDDCTDILGLINQFRAKMIDYN